MNLFTQHRDPPEWPCADFALHLSRLRPVIDLLAHKDPLLANWYLKGWTVGEAHRHVVYSDDYQPLRAALDELAAAYKNGAPDDPKVIGIWNGTEQKDGAAFSISIDGGDVLARGLDLEMAEKGPTSSRLGNYRSVAEVIAKAVEIYAPFYVMFGPRKYFMKAVFEDRPGVSWMLYLPRALTMQQVPEARDLIPVMIDGKQKGTIIVSVTDGVFSVDNAEHVKVANAIEVRLVDQDLLPRFVDL